MGNPCTFIPQPTTHNSQHPNLRKQPTRIDQSYMTPNLFSILEKDQGRHGYDMKFGNNMGVSLKINIYNGVGVGNLRRKFFQLRLQNVAGAAPWGKKVD